MSSNPRSRSRAADVAPFFDGARLTLARQLSGRRKSELANDIGKSATAVAAWESGAKRPSTATVAQLAMALKVSPEFFAVRASNVILSTAPHFRSLRSTTQVSREQADAYGRLAAEIAAEFEQYVEFPDADVPEYPLDPENHDIDGAEYAARQLRKDWSLGPGPVGHLVRLAENHGVLVVFSPPHSVSVDAYSVSSARRPVVVLNPVKDDYYRQRFDVAHELGHLVMHSDSEPGGRIVEDQANRFAAELLMPAEEIGPHLPSAMRGNAWLVLRQLKEQWGVSMQALLYRARQLGRLSDISYQNAMATISARGWRRDEPGHIDAIEQPSLLPKALELLRGEGIDDFALASQFAVPDHLFKTLTARTPVGPTSEASELANDLLSEHPGKVVSLFQDLRDMHRPDAELGKNGRRDTATSADSGAS